MARIIKTRFKQLPHAGRETSAERFRATRPRNNEENYGIKKSETHIKVYVLAEVKCGVGLRRWGEDEVHRPGVVHLQREHCRILGGGKKKNNILQFKHPELKVQIQVGPVPLHQSLQGWWSRLGFPKSLCFQSQMWAWISHELHKICFFILFSSSWIFEMILANDCWCRFLFFFNL